VEYTSIKINDEEILSEPIKQWTTETLETEAGETYKIHAEWQKPDTTPEE
jgi:hypothetical protein